MAFSCPALFIQKGRRDASHDMTTGHGSSPGGAGAASTGGPGHEVKLGGAWIGYVALVGVLRWFGLIAGAIHAGVMLPRAMPRKKR
jgi:hypothetical protein